jgi:O-antigen/teichoic acid export membrane protein
MRVAAVSIPFQLLTLIGLNIFLAVGRIKEFNSLDLLGQSFVLINAVVVLLLLNRGLPSLVTLNTVTNILVALLVASFLVIAGKRLAESKWRADVSLLGQMLSYGIKFHISILAGALIFRADLLVVNLFRGPAEAGVYSVATQVGMMLMLLPGAIATLLFPRVTAEQDQRGETTCQVTRHAAFVMFLCCLAAIPLSLLLPIVYGAAFADATVQLWILLPGVYLVGLQSVLVQHFNALGLPRIIPTFWIVTLVINIILVFTLVPRFGARGAAVASTLSYSLIFTLVTIRFLQTSGRSFGDVFFLRAVELRQLFQLRTGARLLTRGVR